VIQFPMSSVLTFARVVEHTADTVPLHTTQAARELDYLLLPSCSPLSRNHVHTSGFIVCETE